MIELKSYDPRIFNLFELIQNSGWNIIEVDSSNIWQEQVWQLESVWTPEGLVC